MKLRIGDDEYPFDLDTLLISEAMRIKTHTGMGVKGFIEGLQEMDPYALAAAVELVKARKGEVVEFAKLGTLDVFKVEIVEDDDVEDDDEDEDPTQPEEAEDPGTSTSQSSAPNTSSNSRTAGTSRRKSSTA